MKQTTGQPQRSAAEGGQRYLTKDQAAALLGVSRRTVEVWTRDGKLSCYKPTSNCVRYTEEGVARCMERFRVN